VTREDAFRILGLYLGASDEHVRVKHAARREALLARIAAATPAEQTTLRAELAQLDEAAAVASGRAPESSAPASTGGPWVAQTQIAAGGPVAPAPASPARRSRGWIVLVALALGLAGYYVATRAGMWFFDKRHNEPAVPEVIADAELASVAWLTYLSRSGVPETEAGRKATEALHRGAGARAAGDLNLAQREYSTAWQGYFNAFKAEADRAGNAWKDEVVTPWRARVAPFFPFNPQDTRDADVAELSRLINPQDGVLWRQQRWFDALVVAEIKGTRFFTPPTGRADFLAACAALRDALFPPDRDRIHVPFLVRIVHGPLWGKVTFEMGSRVISSERDGEFEAFSWRNESGGCVLRSFGPATRKENGVVDRSGSTWGLLRVLHECRYDGLVDNAHTWSLTAFEQSATPRGKRETPTLQIMVDRKPSPFDPAIYAAARLE
jgi:hypothetical protein